jgi:glutamate/aspartate transport system permease protein
LCAWVIAFAVGSVIGVLRTLPSRAAQAIGNAYVEAVKKPRHTTAV